MFVKAFRGLLTSAAFAAVVYPTLAVPPSLSYLEQPYQQPAGGLRPLVFTPTSSAAVTRAVYRPEKTTSPTAVPRRGSATRLVRGPSNQGQSAAAESSVSGHSQTLTTPNDWWQSLNRQRRPGRFLTDVIAVPARRKIGIDIHADTLLPPDAGACLVLDRSAVSALIRYHAAVVLRKDDLPSGAAGMQDYLSSNKHGDSAFRTVVSLVVVIGDCNGDGLATWSDYQQSSAAPVASGQSLLLSSQ